MNMGYITREIKENFKRYKFSSQICMWSITMTLLITGIFLLGVVNLRDVIKGLKDRIEIVAFLKEGLDSSQTLAIKNRIGKIGNVKSVSYVSPSDALVDFTRDPDMAKQIEIIGENPLPASFGIHLRVESAESIGTVAGEIEKFEGIEEVRYGKEEVNNLIKFVNVLRFSGTIFAVILGILTVTVVICTIRLSIYIRGQEIKVMQMVGSNYWFIRLPFMAEGVIQGLFGGLLSGGLLFLVYFIVKSRMEGLVFLPPPYLLLLVGIGIALGLVGNIIGIETQMKQ